jgi:group I intron endonuclease
MIGIYKITNLKNNKVYIGQSWNIEHRWDHHRRCETSRILKRAYKKHGIENFDFKVILELHEDIATQSLLDSEEKLFIQKYNSRNRNYGYNLKEGGSYGKHSLETITLMSKSKMGEKNAMFGRRQSPEERKRRSLAALGRKQSLEQRKNTSLSKMGKKNPMYGKTGSKSPRSRKVLCIETNIVYDSIIEASRETGAYNISRSIKTNKLSKRRLNWKYV